MPAARLSMDEFDYDLPDAAVAHCPIEPRDAARLLVDMGPGREPEHATVAALADLLHPGDVLVVNDSAVIAARLPMRKHSGAAAEVLLLAPLSDPHLADLAVGSTGLHVSCMSSAHQQPADVSAARNAAGMWTALVRPSRRLAVGVELRSERDRSLTVRVGERLDDRRRVVQVAVGGEPVCGWEQAWMLERAGEAPLPPYIDRDRALASFAESAAAVSQADERPGRADPGLRSTPHAASDGSVGSASPRNEVVDDSDGALWGGGASGGAADDGVSVLRGDGASSEAVGDGDGALWGGGPSGDAARRALRERYQTVYARRAGSVAAPTAGMHLTERLLNRIAARGVKVVSVELAVGMGTFAPVHAHDAYDHRMHAERYRISAEAWNACLDARRVVAVGTTALRALESAARQADCAARLPGGSRGASDSPRSASAAKASSEADDAMPRFASGHSPAVRTRREIDDAASGATGGATGGAAGGAADDEPGQQGRLVGPLPADADIGGVTDLFLKRGDEFRIVDALLTNFHLPRSTLLLLIDAFIGPRWRDLYTAALDEGYRFLSFGDAMLLHHAPAANRTPYWPEPSGSVSSGPVSSSPVSSNPTSSGTDVNSPISGSPAR